MVCGLGVDSPVVFGFLWVWCGIGLQFGCFLGDLRFGCFLGGFGWAVCGAWLLPLGGLAYCLRVLAFCGVGMI